MKRNTYKYGFIKAILDNIFNSKEIPEGFYISYLELFSKFAENYWNLVAKYSIKQMRRDNKSEYSRIEVIINNMVKGSSELSQIEFHSLEKSLKDEMIKQVMKECSRTVLGALYEDFEGLVYGFDIKGTGITISPSAYIYITSHKVELEKLNYYSWAKFLEKINSDEATIRLLAKLELATPKRNNLAKYREYLRDIQGEKDCFYCEKELSKTAHVDHFIPWSFIKDDKIWNLVLACPRCNIMKRDKLPPHEYIKKIIKRNELRRKQKESPFIEEFTSYRVRELGEIWQHARRSGYKEMNKI
ncbi:HNH endonuclease domain-containing protein [Ohessyouella blattaphilus]|uniref:HNH endonuclease n=1 Tax=Ohessyouella blattaphilus TaxID=2949333 RepID=A0ABT1EJM4_9FIRM|nr:HNH endonuclease domain-containing protein [Ohessyouella blattaphilus]MCP1110894.1 HNH endonuclease [Ohessyouella blattaphilus]MCR8564288.1 HNH endonuclease [Ohessyouella blattaphilus]